MKNVAALYRLINCLSIDVVLGAISSALFFLKVFHVPISLPGLLVLGITVWIVYTADRLLDVRKRPELAQARHTFHKQHATTLTWCCAAGILIIMSLVLTPSPEVIRAGVALGVLVIVYLLTQKHLWFAKELVVAVYYTAGVLILSSDKVKEGITSEQGFLMLLFGLIAWINLILFSWFEVDQDKQSNQFSYATGLGRQGTSVTLIILFLSSAITLGMFLTNREGELIILGVMLLVLLTVFCFPAFFRKNERYRIWGDAVFLIPALIWLI